MVNTNTNTSMQERLDDIIRTWTHDAWYRMTVDNGMYILQQIRVAFDLETQYTEGDVYTIARDLARMIIDGRISADQKPIREELVARVEREIDEQRNNVIDDDEYAYMMAHLRDIITDMYGDDYLWDLTYTIAGWVAEDYIAYLRDIKHIISDWLAED